MGPTAVYFIFNVNLYIILYSLSLTRKKKCWKCQTQTTKIFSKIFHPQQPSPLHSHSPCSFFYFILFSSSSLGDFSDFSNGIFYMAKKQTHSLSCELKRNWKVKNEKRGREKEKIFWFSQWKFTSPFKKRHVHMCNKNTEKWAWMVLSVGEENKFEKWKRKKWKLLVVCRWKFH